MRPDTNPWFIAPVIDEWAGKQEDGNAAHAIPGTRFRASKAGDCSRALAYYFGNVEVSDPFTVADIWRFNVGTLLHEHVQAAIKRAFPGSEDEVVVKLAGVDGSGRMDLLVIRPNENGEIIRSSVEVKSVNGFRFKSMVCGTKGRPPEGPSWKYLLQGSINAYSCDPRPDELVIVAFSLENVSPAEASKARLASEFERFSAQWSFTREQYEQIAERELDRVAKIMAKTDELGPGSIKRYIPDPEIPKRHEIVDPSRGLYVTYDEAGNDLGVTGATWHCRYCSYQTVCDADRKFGQ